MCDRYHAYICEQWAYLLSGKDNAKSLFLLRKIRESYWESVIINMAVDIGVKLLSEYLSIFFSCVWLLECNVIGGERMEYIMWK